MLVLSRREGELLTNSLDSNIDPMTSARFHRHSGRAFPRPGLRMHAVPA